MTGFGANPHRGFAQTHVRRGFSPDSSILIDLKPLRESRFPPVNIPQFPRPARDL
jgi:hypothetical protein